MNTEMNDEMENVMENVMENATEEIDRVRDLIARADERGYITQDVPVNFDEAISMGVENFLDFLSEAVTGTIFLTDISYQPSAVADGHIVILRVTGDISEVLDWYEQMSDDIVTDESNRGA